MKRLHTTLSIIALVGIFTYAQGSKIKKMGKSKTIEVQIKSSIDITSPKEKIFEIIIDHEEISNWVMEVKKVQLIKKGKPKNGLGAIREVDFKPMFWTTIQEEIVFYEENNGYKYKIISYMPGVVDHLGTWTCSKNENGDITVTWNVFLELKKSHWFTLFASKKFARDFKQVQENALTYLKKSLED